MKAAEGKYSNRLLAILPTKQREHILEKCEPVELEMGEILFEEGDRVRNVYFPTTSFVSVLKSIDKASLIEVGMIGAEGMLGYTVVLGDQTAPLRAQTQGAGSALRLSAAAFRQNVEQIPRLRQLMFRYWDVMLRQIAQTAACTRFHVVENRLARWLLMTQDRAHSETFAVTQEFLAHMLGVRRSGVTEAASALQTRNVIHYVRGQLTILDRQQLKASACSCYVSDLETYWRGVGYSA